MAETLPLNDTIAALSSGSLPAGIAVVRVSGPSARLALCRLADHVPPPRKASLRTLRDGAGAPLDRAVVLFFEGPASATGEDLAEFHLHGGRSVVADTLGALVALPGVRLAEAGEFTRRAFVNGRIDLTEAEGLADLLAAQTAGQRRRALVQAGGAHRTLYEDWSRRLLHARAMLEADFDFADEDDVAADVAASVLPAIAGLVREIEGHLAGASRGEILREGLRVVIAGAPNAGKSSLLNVLAGREAAIVSPVPGTTRDAIEVTLDLGGVPVRLVDTAGIRETDDPVERIGIERAEGAIAAADLVLLLEPAGPVAALPSHMSGDAAEVWRVRSKADNGAGPGPAVSARTGAGIGELLERLGEEARRRAGEVNDPVPTRERHRLALSQALAILTETDREDLPSEILAETLRRAGDAIGSLTGRTDVEDLLAVIFSEFCIGK